MSGVETETLMYWLVDQNDHDRTVWGKSFLDLDSHLRPPPNAKPVRPSSRSLSHCEKGRRATIAPVMDGYFDVEHATERIIKRLDELGDSAAAERLRIALVGSTSGEILTSLGIEFQRLLRTKLRSDEEVGRLLRETKYAVDDALYATPRWLRWLRRMRWR